ncbi:signal peptidase I [Bryobacterales bacterium F-183]|nr:signal peptidase I [Bryobacterales bacterium F-183]
MQKYLLAVRDFVSEWTVTILILLFGTTTLMQAFVVPTSSMESTVLVGDHLIVDKLAYSPPGSVSRFILPYTEVKRGDIIVFKFPPDPRQSYVKRVMGVPGDRLKIVNKQVFLNGHPLTEPYKQHIHNFAIPYRDGFPDTPQDVPVEYMSRVTEMMTHVDQKTGELVVPEGRYFAMGDNRDNSLDSRYWGWVPRENIIGKPTIIFWSYATSTENLVDFRLDHFLDLATNFFSKTRWDRTLKLVRGYDVK